MQKTYLRKFLAPALLACLINTFYSAAYAEIRRIEPENRKFSDDNKIAKVYFFGEMNQDKAKDLSAVLDEININHADFKNIYLYINSPGGDMNSGYISYWAVKSSKIPVSTVNLSVTASAATMMFCGSYDRMSIKGAYFILHPPAVVEGNIRLKPDELLEVQENLDGYRQMFASIYSSCTNYSAAEISTILSSEDNRKRLADEDAIKHGLIKKNTDAIVNAPIAYYITDDRVPAGRK